MVASFSISAIYVPISGDGQTKVSASRLPAVFSKLLLALQEGQRPNSQVRSLALL